MPISDTVKLQIAQKRRLFFKVCRYCGARNSIASVKCRKCHSYNLRLKKREIKK